MAEGEEEKKKNVGGDENPNPSQFPPGFRFMPTDDELIEYYLLPRLQGRPHVPNDAIIEDYVYSCHPDDLLLNGEYKDKGQDDAWYFLSPTARKYANGGRPSRGTHDRRGRWKASTGSALAVTAGNVQYCHRGLCYYNGPSYKDEDKSNWLMRELSIPQYKNKLGDKGDGSETKTLDKFVMCKIYMTTREPKKKKMDAGAGPSGKCEEKCPPASRSGPVETSQETAKPEISERQKGKRPVEAASAKLSPPPLAPDRCLRPQAGPAPTQSLYGGGMHACSGTTEYPNHYGGTDRAMAYNPHTSMPWPPMAFNSQMPAYPPTPVPSSGYFEQMMMRQQALAGQAFRPPRSMTVPGSPAAGQAFRPPRPMTVPSSPACQASRPPRPMTVPSFPAGQASRPPRPMTAPSYPVMQRQPETEEMRERRVYQQHMNELMMMHRMMQQQKQQPQTGNAAYAPQQSRPMPFIQHPQQQHAMPRPSQFLHCNYHQPVEAGQQQVQCGYPVPDFVAGKTTPAEADAGSIGAKNEGTDIRGGDCNNDKEKGSLEVPTEEQPRLTTMTANTIQRTGVLDPKLESDD